MSEQEDPELTSCQEHIKTTTTYIDQLLQRMTRGLAKCLIYKQACKERTTQSLVGGEEKRFQSGPTPVTGDPEEEGFITGSGILPKEQWVQAPYQALQSWGLTP